MKWKYIYENMYITTYIIPHLYMYTNMLEYYSALKRMKFWYMLLIVEHWKHYAKQKKPDKKGHVQYDSTHMRNLEWGIHKDRE